MDGWLGITRYTARTLHGAAMLGPSQPRHDMYMYCVYLSISIFALLTATLESLGTERVPLKYSTSFDSATSRLEEGGVARRANAQRRPIVAIASRASPSTRQQAGTKTCKSAQGTRSHPPGQTDASPLLGPAPVLAGAIGTTSVQRYNMDG